MKKRISTLLSTMIGTSIYTQQGVTSDLASQCMLGVPSYNRPLVHGEISELPVTITAANAKGNYPDNATFTGNVCINQGNSRLQADEVQLHQKQPDGAVGSVRTVDALGNVHYDDNQIILKGLKAWSNLNTKDINVWEGNYQMVERQGRGKAKLMKQRGENRYTILESGSFTSCLPGSNTWSVVGSELIHNREEQVAEIWNARFKLGPVPVFYSPYLQLPLGDKRRSGFLIPNAKYSVTNYFEFFVPYYLDVAPNMDATITPHYLHRRGNIMWENEFRYLTQAGMGLTGFHYLPSDKMFEDEYLTKDGCHRWLYYWQHSGVIDHVWRLNVNYTKVSDPYYFNDFLSKYGSSTDSYATQMFSVGYVRRNFDATVSTRQFQLFSNKTASTYDADPQLDVNWYQNVGPFDMRIYGQAVHFVNTNFYMPEATRVHFEPGINLMFLNNWANLDTEVKLMATHYQQKNLDDYKALNNADLEESVNRSLPQFKVDGKLVFKRDMNLATGYTQTLEPRIQYLYVPYRDQSRINNYDSSFLQSDYCGLFRDRNYGGLDRIASANQITAGATSRIFDNNAFERSNISIAQIYFFAEPRTGDDNVNWENNKRIGSLVWSGDAYWRISDRSGSRIGVQYDTRLDSISTSSASVEYRYDEDRIVQLGYRYASQEYIQATLPGYFTAGQYNRGVSQVGGTASWTLADRWSVVGAYYFATNTHKAADQKLGLQYNSCCYAIRVGYERKLNGLNVNGNQSAYNNLIGFNIELRGLTSNYGLGTQQMLRSSSIPYRSSL